MGFYKQLSSRYDEIFAVNPAEMRFAVSCLAGRRRLLDMGCGTGNKTEILAGDKDAVTAFVLDPGMIAQARRNHARANIDYRVLNMLEIGRAFPPAGFDSAACLGNTLVHLSDPGEIPATLLATRGGPDRRRRVVAANRQL